MMTDCMALGGALSTVGLVGYLATGRKSPTALIPLGFGLAFVGLGLAGDGTSSLGHVATGLAVLGLAATGRALVAALRPPRRAATLSKAAMAACCLAFVGTRLAGLAA